MAAVFLCSQFLLLSLVLKKKKSMACTLNNDSNFTGVVWKLAVMKVMNLSVRSVICSAVYDSLPFGQTGSC